MALINDSFEQSHHPAAMTLNGLQKWGQFAVLGLVFPFINVCTRPQTQTNFIAHIDDLVHW